MLVPAYPREAAPGAYGDGGGYCHRDLTLSRMISGKHLHCALCLVASGSYPPMQDLRRLILLGFWLPSPEGPLVSVKTKAQMFR